MNPSRKAKIESVVLKRQLDLCVVLENVYDDHNIGAVLRSCDAVGIQYLYILNTFPDNKKKYIKVGKRTSAGTRKYLKVYYFNDAKACFDEIAKKYNHVFGTGLGEKSVSLYNLDFSGSAAIVFGNEKTGITENTQKYINSNFVIPQVGVSQSLNISVACAVSLYEVYRQRQLLGKYIPELTQERSELLDIYMDRAKLKPDPPTEYKIFSDKSSQ